MSTLEKAVEIAARAHAGQRDRSGEPRLLHLLRLMMVARGSQAQIAAVLQDVIEDTMINLGDLRAAGFCDVVLSAVDALTKRTGETRLDAAERAADDPVALQLSLAKVTDQIHAMRSEPPSEHADARLAELQPVKTLLESRLAEMQSRRYKLWVLDDNADNICMIEQSFHPTVKANLEVVSFLSAEAFLSAFEIILNAVELLPDFVLLDFFLGTMYGSDVLERLTQAWAERDVSPTVIIAHSSEIKFSELMVAQGADFALEKIKGLECSAALREVFSSPEDLAWLRRYRRPRDAHLASKAALDELAAL